jgi:hypothetical protein
MGTIAWLVVANPAPAASDTKLDRALLKNAPEVIKYLSDHKCKAVGVLKFLVQKGSEQPTDNAGPLNLNIANRLEVALVLANPDEKLGIIRHASEAVSKSKNRRANHLTADGRKALFEVPYILAWGKDDTPVQADVLLAGLVKLSPDLKTTTVQIQAFSKDKPDLEKVVEFSAPTDARTLTENGRSYRLRQLFQEKDDEAASSASDTDAGKADNPLKNSNIQWTILYDDKPMPIEFNGGVATVKGPVEDQQVAFRLANKGKDTYAVVLKVNGENTLYRQRFPSDRCRKWVLDPNDQFTIYGFQVNQGNAAKFEVLSPEESERDEVNYGPHAGTFSLEVFPGKQQVGKTPTNDAEETVVAAIGSGDLPATKPIQRASLKQKLMEENSGKAKETGGTRQLFGEGRLIGAGKQVKSEVKSVEFVTGPVPVMSVTVRYYQPRR